MFSKLFGTDKFLDLLGNMQFWFTLAIIIGVIVILVSCIKYPKIGMPILVVVFGVAMICLSAYCGVQLNYYYKAEGGIYGKITGIYNTNEIEIVDNLSFELKNIELLEKTEGLYSASIMTDNVLSFDSIESMGVFINSMPCDISSQVHKDYIIANYTYTFYDNNQQEILTDTLVLNFAFYEDSTYLNLSTKGGAEAVKYWHYYFNKNGFVVEIKPFSSISNEITESSGDVSQYIVVTYEIDGNVVSQQIYNPNELLKFPAIDDKHTAWTLNGEEIEYDSVVTENMTLSANYLYEFEITLNVQDETYQTETIHGTSLSFELPTCVYSSDPRYNSRFIVESWSLDGNVIDPSTLVVNNDLTLVADGYIEYLVKFIVADEEFEQWVKEGTYATEPNIPEYYSFEKWTTSSSDLDSIDISSYPIMQETVFVANGTYLQTVNFYVDDEVYHTAYVNYGEVLAFPQDPVKEEYKFFGWSLDGIMKIEDLEITEDLNVYALFGTDDSLLLSVYANAGMFKIVSVEDEIFVRGTAVKETYMINKEISIMAQHSVESVDYSIETDGTYEIKSIALGYDKIVFSDCTYVNLIISCRMPGGSGVM